MNTRDTVFELDLTNHETGWKSSAAHMPVSRGGVYGAAVGDKFYAFGWEGNPETVTGVFNQPEAFDAETQKWTELKPMAVPRHGTQAASAGGLVYIPGGGLQQDGKAVSVNGSLSYMQLSSHFDSYCV
ncbi:kelch repeat-containing protein [Fusarium pseudoanthophilum]|uniref:Kelch repeat-containing protein n=1 Tax=Fusarium pseudoanthophilum TaxID=48495 RepID=A0A8H5JY39_9HYPO|nr:kelch repeat-containing protein [Fusarium pseudoanthophilum]